MVRIIDLRLDRPALVDAAAALLHAAFRGRSQDWQDLESARAEVDDARRGPVARPGACTA